MGHISRRLTGALLLAVCVVVGAAAQEPGGLIPSFGNGRLTVTGDGFKPGERVTLTITVDGTRQQRTVLADRRGHFAVATGIAVHPGAGVQLDARGDQGTGMAAMTAVPGLLPATGTAPVPGAWLAVFGCVVVGVGIVVRRQRVAR